MWVCTYVHVDSVHEGYFHARSVGHGVSRGELEMYIVWTEGYGWTLCMYVCMYFLGLQTYIHMPMFNSAE